MHADRPNNREMMPGRAVASWASILLDYVDLKANLLAVESKEAVSHFIALLVMVAVLVVLVLCSVLMYGAFLLYLIALLLHLPWGWSALICGGLLTVAGVVVFFLLRARLRKPVFQLTIKDLAKDREWLTRVKTKTS
jgi:uncharacterized membrane protein YqjE